MNTPTRKPIEEELREFMVARGWDSVRPSDIAKSVCIEAAELLEIFQWSNPSVEETLQDEKKMEKIRLELADVLIYALNMAVSLGLDTDEIIRAKLALADKKYPAELMKAMQDRAEPGTDETYLKIKEEYRKKAA